MFENQPKGLYAMAFANIGERFGYYTMLAVFALFLKDNFGWSEGWAAEVYSDFLMLVYFLPLIGGIVADKVGFGKCVTAGIAVMFLGYLLLAIPAGKDIMGASLMFGALALISIGTSLFKGNLQVMVGNLYDDPKYASQRDTGFSIFYMGINVGAMFAPTAAIYMMSYLQETWGMSKADSYHGAFGVACLSLIVSMAVYLLTRKMFKHVDYNSKNAPKDGSVKQVELTPAETKQRIVALCLVFAVVIFFWMAFHQNGSTLTFFAEQFTQKDITGVETMVFDVRNLVACIVIIYTLFTLFGKSSSRAKAIAGGVMALALAYLGYQYFNIEPETIEAPIFQQFNAAFVVGLTPVVMAVFGWLAKKGKEPSAPRKIGYGMLVAGLGYVVMVIGSLNLLTPAAQKAAEAGILVSPNWLISTYFVLTIAELLLSPMGISFVSKVAPPKYKGMMMGGWFVATAIGNKLVAIPGYLWGDLPLTVVWGVLIALCLISFIFIFSIMKKLEKVC